MHEHIFPSLRQYLFILIILSTIDIYYQWPLITPNSDKQFGSINSISDLDPFCLLFCIPLTLLHSNGYALFLTLRYLEGVRNRS